jgi:hypothetical protein
MFTVHPRLDPMMVDLTMPQPIPKNVCFSELFSTEQTAVIGDERNPRPT